MKMALKILIPIFLCLSAYGSNYADSLKTVLATLPNDKARCDRLSEVAFEAINQDPAIAYELAEELLKLSEKTRYKQGVAYANYHFANINNYLDEFEKGRINFSKAYSLFEELGDEMGMGFCGNSFGEMLTTEGAYDDALTELFKAKQHFENAGYSAGVAWVHNNIGVVHNYQENYKEALKYFNEALKTADDVRSGDAWLYITMTYLDMEQYAEAEKSVVKALELAKKNQDAYVLADCYRSLGRIEAFYGKNPEALKHLEEARELKKMLEDDQGWSILANEIGGLFLKTNQLDSALSHIREAWAVSNTAGIRLEMSNSSLGLSNVFNRMQLYDSAYYYLAKHKEIDDILEGEEAGKKLAELEASLAAKQRDLEHQNEIKIQETQRKAEKKEKQLMLGAGVIVIVLLVLFSVFMVSRFRMKQRANKQLEAFNKEILHQRDIIEEKNKDIMDSIKYAKRIQEAILPSDKVIRKVLNQHFVLYKPKDIVSGDFYWATEVQLPTGNNGILIAAVDCTGHGVPGAMVSVVGYNGLNRAVQEYRLIHPAEILDKLTELVEETFSKHDSEVRDGMDISLCLVDMDNCRMEWAGANNPVWVVRNGELTETKANKQPIGRYEGRKPFDNQEYNLERGDVVYIFTDGYQDQFGGPGQKKFKASKMKEMFSEIYNTPMDEQQNFINQTIEQWRHCPQEDGTIEEVEQLDDICIIAFRM